MKVEFIDLKAQHESIREELSPVVERILASGRFILGEEVSKLEEEIASYCGVKYAVGVASGTDALLLSLRASGVGKGYHSNRK